MLTVRNFLNKSYILSELTIINLIHVLVWALDEISMGTIYYFSRGGKWSRFFIIIFFFLRKIAWTNVLYTILTKFQR